jgi:hypothetical protein
MRNHMHGKLAIRRILDRVPFAVPPHVFLVPAHALMTIAPS